MHMVNTAEQATRKPRPWGMIAALLLVAGIISFILYLWAYGAASDDYVKHPCPTPPVPWFVWATLWLAMSIFSAAFICFVIAAIAHWKVSKATSSAYLLGAFIALLPFTMLTDNYSNQYYGENGPKPCSGSSVTGPDS
ncbi:hypothetical protein HMPREF9336_04171 [Segniliparus rugosus ATCC BAA-974]|uniref:Transmembrane protein n=1 Tax=Segniliparus rugosus (strain ATCC BAA-974 / DSM 45345 / CCUG 50838 / CIP 108380 / JCM 13579 / CDC 945) TaxID=679197 RepID=U1M2F3_SEGRC|nr:hypothetical protein HMPREF9336_04171 [Segniliparus rugosus ATCC BAA-974]